MEQQLAKLNENLEIIWDIIDTGSNNSNPSITESLHDISISLRKLSGREED